MKNKGTLYVFSAPSGCGKGTVLNEIFSRMPNLRYSVSATTRAPREGETDGVSYHFVTKEEFERLIESDGMLEHAFYCDNYYGTPRKEIERCLANGEDVILEIETDGAMQVKSKCPEAVLIFMLPPSLEILKNRLLGRGTDSEEVISKRIGKAEKEISMSKNYDFVFVNDDLNEAAETLYGIMKYSKNLTRNNLDLIKGVLR